MTVTIRVDGLKAGIVGKRVRIWTPEALVDDTVKSLSALDGKVHIGFEHVAPGNDLNRGYIMFGNCFGFDPDALCEISEEDR